MIGRWYFLITLAALEISNTECKKKLLIGGMFPMSGGWAGGISCLPATELALEDVNNDSSILPDYELKLVAVDSKCMPGLSLRSMYDLLYDNETKLVLITGCSSVSTFVAQAAKMWNLIVLSYGSSSPALSDPKRFPTFFRTHPSATLHNPTRLMLFRKFNWRKIATVQQTEEVFTSTIKDLEEVVKEAPSVGGEESIEIAVRQSFQTDPTNAVKGLKRQDARIIVGVFYEDMARKVFCQAYKEGLYGKKYVWLILGWYPDLWYTKKDPNIDCTPDQLKQALEGHLTTEVVQYNLDPGRLTDTGIKTSVFKKRLEVELKKRQGLDLPTSALTSLSGFVEAPLAYDAIWALSFALQRTATELSSQGRSLEDFNYMDNATTNAILANLNRTNFEGVSGRVSFTATGDRIAKTQIEQMQNGTYKVIGVYDYITEDLDWYNTDVWPEGKPPADRTLIEDTLRIHSTNLLYAMLTLSTAGVIFAFVSLFFTACSVQYSIISNSLPVMNCLIVFGCIMCLVCVPLFGMDGSWLDTTRYSAVCQIRTWLIVIGFTMSYGTMFVKVFYSWRISKEAKESKTVSSKTIDALLISQREPFAILATLLALDIILLGAWQGLDPLTRVVEEFEPIDPDPGLKDNIDIKYKPLLEHCSCDNINVWIGVTYGYKGCLLVIGLFLAYETRSVKIRLINDLRFLAMAVYNIVVLCVIAVPVTFIIPSQQNASFVFVSVAIILSCYLTMALLFIPKMVPIFSKRIDMDEQETRTSLLHHENEKRFEQLKQRNDHLKLEILQKEQSIRELHAVLQKKFTTQLSNDKRQASDSAFSEENSNNDRLHDSSDASTSSKPRMLHSNVITERKASLSTDRYILPTTPDN